MIGEDEMIRNRFSIMALVSIVMNFAPALAAGPLNMSGYYKNFSIVLDPVEYGTQGNAAHSSLTGSVSNRFRIDALWELTGNTFLDLAYDFSPRIQDGSLFDDDSPLLRPDPLMYRIADLERRLYPDDDSDARAFAIFHNLDRAVLSVSTELADFYVGRQAIAWGSARVINPTDVLAPFAFSELDIEDRTGIDAIRVRIPTGMMGEIDLGYVCGKDARFASSALYARTRFYAVKTDITLMAVDFRENLLTGIDLARSIGGAGAWIECAIVFVDAFHNSQREHTRNYTATTCGIDYNLTGALYGFCEYHFNTSGAGESESYIDNILGPAFQEGAAYLLGTHYLAPGMIYRLTPLSTMSAQALWNMTDASLLLAPRFEYSLAEDVFLEAGFYLGLGESASVSNGSDIDFNIRPASEFGLYPDFYFTSFRVYF